METQLCGGSGFGTEIGDLAKVERLTSPGYALSLFPFPRLLPLLLVGALNQAVASCSRTCNTLGGVARTGSRSSVVLAWLARRDKVHPSRLASL